MQNYVISLANAQQRRQHIQAEFGKHRIPFQFFDAMTPSPELTNFIQAACPELLHFSRLTDGEKACFASHLQVWQQCIDQNLPYVVVFEDDVVLSNSAPYFLNETAWLEERFVVDSPWVLRLETFLDLVVFVNDAVLPPYHNRHFAEFKTPQMGMAGYIISRQAIEILLEKIKYLTVDELDAIDNLLFGSFLALPNVKMRMLNPAICIQERRVEASSQLGSQLEEERARIFVKKTYTLWEKIKRLPEKPKRMRLNRARRALPFE